MGEIVTSRPGVPDYYNQRQVSQILGCNRRTLRRWTEAGLLRCRPHPLNRHVHLYPRSDLLRFCRAYAYPTRLLRLDLQPRAGRLIALTADRELRPAFDREAAVVTTSAFALGGLLAGVPCWGVLLDADAQGLSVVLDAGRRLAAAKDRPYLIAVLGEAHAPKTVRGVFDMVLTRPLTRANLRTTIRRLGRVAGSSQPRLYQPWAAYGLTVGVT